MNAKTAILRQVARRIVFSLALPIALLAALAATGSAQTIAYFADPVATSFGGASGNPPALNIGNTFHVTGSGITVYQLGAFDWQGDGLATAHTVALFTNQTALASVTVPAGTAAPLSGGFRLAPLPSPIFLPAGNYAVVSYQMNANDPYGDYNGDNPAGFNTGASLTRGDGIFEFTLSGTSYPNNVASGYNFVSATFTYVDSTGVWSGAGADNNWSTSANWNNGLPAFPTVVTFGGTTRTVNNNDLTGLTLNGIIYDPAAGAFTLNGNDLTLSGNISFGSNPSAPVTQKINLNMAWGGYENIETPANGNLILAGNITSANGLTKIDNGTLTLSGTNTIAGAIFNGGTNIITGNTTINGTGGSVFYVGSRNAAYKGTLVLQPGSALTVIGNFGDAAVVGRDGGSGTVIQNGGTFTFSPNNNQSLFVAATGSSATRAEYHMNGGVLDMSNNRLGIGFGATFSTGMVSQVSGVITNVGNLLIPFISGSGNGIGIYTLSGGSIYIGSGGITSDGNRHEINLGGGTVGAYATWFSTLSMNLTNLNGSVTFNPGGNTILLSGVLSGNGGLTVAGGGVLELSGANTYTGDTIVTAGSTLQLDATGSSLGALRVANGALLNLNFSGTYAVSGFYTNGVALPVGTYNAGNLSAFIAGSGNLQVASSISTGLWTGSGANNNWSTGGNWDQNAVPVFPIGLTFAGSARLANNNDLSGITASSILFDSAAGAFVLGGNDITLSGNLGFSGNPSAPITQTVNLNMTWTGDKIIDTPTNGNLTLGGAINSLNSLTKLDAGTLNLGGTDLFAGYSVNGGTNIVTGNVAINGTSGHRIYLGDGGAITNCSGALVIQNGAAFNVTGNFDDALVIGRDSGSGTVIQNGGTFTFSPGNQTFLFVGATSRTGTRAEYDLNGGLFDMGGNTLGVALGDGGVSTTGMVNQVGGVINNVGSLQLGAVRATGYGVYTLGGGSINIGFGGITTASGLYSINLGGGTVAASTSWSSSLNMNLTNLNGSVTFDTAGNTITLSGVLSGNGGLTKIGSGTLELSATNTYTGATTINEGALQLDGAGTSPGAFHIANGALLNLNFSGSYIVAGCFTNGVALPNGVYNAGNLPGFILGSGNLQVASVVFSGQPQNQLVYLNGNYHQSTTLTSATTGGSATYQWYLNGNPVPGATGTNLTLSNLQITNGGNYYVVATGSSGSVTSSVASVTIYAVNNNVFAYDGFGYPDSVVVDGASQNGGFGWNGPWQHTDGNGVQITLGNLVGGASVPSGYDSRCISNCIEVPSNAQTRSGRFFDCSTNSELSKQGFINASGNIGADGKTIYLSFLQQPDRTSGFYELEFHRGNLSDPGRIGGIGNDTGTGNVNLRAPNGVNNRSLGAGTTTVNFYVVRIDYKAGNDDVFVYRNPTSITEPAAASLTVSNVADMSLNGVSVAAYNGPDVKTDEIRLGATWADAIGLAVSNILPPAKTANGWKVSFAATPGYSYRIQRAASLTGPWTDIDTVTAPENGYVEYVDPGAPSGQSFYRTVTP